MTEWDAPNQQVVRADGSAPWDEGAGGDAEPEPEPAAKKAAAKSGGKKKADKDE